MQHFRVHVFSMQIISQLNLSFDMLITALLLKKMIKTSWIVAYHDPSLLLPISRFNLSYTEEIWCRIYVESIFTQKLLVIYLWNLHIELNMTFSFLSRKTEIVLSCKTYLYNHCFIYNLKKHFFLECTCCPASTQCPGDTLFALKAESLWSPGLRNFGTSREWT